MSAPQPPDWASLAEQMSACPWSPEAREAGLWAIATLREELGPRWPRAWAEPGAAPVEIVSSPWMLSAFAATLGLALALRELRETPGVARLRATLCQSARADARASPRLQLRFAAVARRHGLEVRLEPLLAGARTRADLLVAGEGEEIGVEALAVLRDRRSTDADHWLVPIKIELILIGQRHGVDFDGAIEAPLPDSESAGFLTDVEAHARAVSAGLAVPELRRAGLRLTVRPASGAGGAIDFRYPMFAFDRRLAGKLATKVRQTRRSGARWLLVDALDHLWHLSAWSPMDLGQKALALAGLLRRELASAEHLRGAVITDGAALLRPDVEEERIEFGTEALALRRRLDAWHVRESVIVPLRDEGVVEARLWRRLLEAEGGWLGAALAAQGLDAPPELVASPAE